MTYDSLTAYHLLYGLLIGTFGTSTAFRTISKGNLRCSAIYTAAAGTVIGGLKEANDFYRIISFDFFQPISTDITSALNSTLIGKADLDDIVANSISIGIGLLITATIYNHSRPRIELAEQLAETKD